jgi:hypothetical protein
MENKQEKNTNLKRKIQIQETCSRENKDIGNQQKCQEKKKFLS